MTLDDRLTNYYRETVRVDGNTPNSRQRATQAILSDLLELIEENCIYEGSLEIRYELLIAVKEYCK